MKKRTLLGLMAMAPAVWLTGCGGSNGNNASVRLVNASAGYASLDLYADDSKLLSSVAYGTASGYADASDGTVVMALTSAGSGTYLLSQSRSVSAGSSYTIVAYGWAGALQSTIVSDDVDAADSGKTKFSVQNAAFADAGSVDVYLTAEGDDLEAATAVATGVDSITPSSTASVTSGTYRLRVTGVDDKSDLRLDVSGVVLSSTNVVTYVLAPTAGGVLVNGIQVVQGGTVTKQFNTQARVRAVAAMTNSAKLSLTAGGTSLVSNAPSPSIGGYTLVTAGSLTLAGTAGSTALPSSSLTVAAGSDVTVMVHGDATSPTLTTLVDDNRLPSVSTKLKLRLVNAMNGMSSYPLTMAVDYSAVASSVAEGAASSYASLTANSAATLEVTSALSATPLYSLIDTSLVAEGVYSVFMFGTADVPSGGLRKER